MRQAPVVLLTALVALGSDSVLAQTTNTVLVRMVSDDTCLVADVHVSCREVGAKMRELKIPLNANIEFPVDGYRSLEAIRVMMDSIRRAGYKVDKVGYITTPQT